jgi:predicted Zn-dependent protease
MRRLLALPLLLAALALGGCAAPGGPPETTAVRAASDARLGAGAHRQILARYGGAYEGAVAGYVRDLGMRIAARSEQPDAAWTFTVLDTPVVNAFAIPGGYVYVTRGLIALADDEAELAGVIGHEIGHVTANHSAERRTQSAVAQLGVLAAVIGAAALGVEGPALDAVGQVGSAVGQGAVASYSRAQELEADRLGVRYLARAGYDPSAQADFLESLSEQTALQARLAGGAYDPNRVDFFATHPATAARVREAIAAVEAEGGLAAPAGAPRNRDAFLRAIEGMTYGDSAAHGFVRDGRFIHPELRLAFAAPEGWRIVNAAQAVTMRGPGGSVVFDGGADPGGPLERYVGEVWPAQIARGARTGRVQDLSRFTIDGMEAAAAWLPVQTRGGGAAARLTAIRAPDGRLWRFLGLADPGNPAAMEAVAAAPRSFRRLSSAEAARFRPWRIAIRAVRAGDSVASLAARTPFETEREARFRVMNGLKPGETLRPGQRVKLVVE